MSDLRPGKSSSSTSNLAVFSLLLICLLGSILPATSAPPTRQQQPEGARKYAVKPNHPKKVFHKQQVSALELQQIQQMQAQHQQQLAAQQQQQQQQQQALLGEPPHNPLMNSKINDIGSPSDLSGPNSVNGNFPWSFLSNSLMQLVRMFFGVPNELSGNGLTPAMDKMDGGPSAGQGFSWGQVIGYGLKLLFAALGGPTTPEYDGIDKIGVEGGPSGGNGVTPVQGLMKSLLGALVNGDDPTSSDNMAKQTHELINLALALMNALKTSFSQRAMRARSLGEKDKLSDFTLASLDMAKAYAKSFNTSNEHCREQRICEAARECVQDLGQPNAYGICHVTAYATANLMYYTQSSSSDMTKSYLDAARKGRSQQDCSKLYECNEVV